MSEQQYEQIVAALYDGVLDGAAWESAMRQMARAVNGLGPLLLAINPTTGTILRDETRDYGARFFAEFRRDWAAKDIRVPAGLSVPLGVPIRESQILPRGDWERSEVFNEFCLKNDAAWFLATWIHKTPQKATCLSIQAAAERGPFGEEDARTIAPLFPHIRRALDIRDRLEGQQAQAKSLQSALSHAAFGVIVLDQSGSVLDVSEVASAMLSGTPVIQRRAGERFSLAEPTGGLIRQLIQSRMRLGSLNDGAFHVSRGAARSALTAVLAPLPDIAALWTASEPRWLLFLFDPYSAPDLSIEALRIHCKLTAREAELAARLASGASLAEAATKMGISGATARTYLKSVFAKTGARSQADLTRLVLSGPAQLRL